MIQYTTTLRWLKIVFWVNSCITAVATLYFGWHYVADDIAGVAIALVAFYVGGWASGQSFTRQREPVERSAARKLQPCSSSSRHAGDFWEFCESCSFCDSRALACCEVPRVERKPPEALPVTPQRSGGAPVHRVGVTALALSLVTGLAGVAAASAAPSRRRPRLPEQAAGARTPVTRRRGPPTTSPGSRPSSSRPTSDAQAAAVTRRAGRRALQRRPLGAAAGAARRPGRRPARPDRRGGRDAQRHAYAATVVTSYEMGPSLSPLAALPGQPTASAARHQHDVHAAERPGRDGPHLRLLPRVLDAGRGRQRPGRRRPRQGRDAGRPGEARARRRPPRPRPRPTRPARTSRPRRPT